MKVEDIILRHSARGMSLLRSYLPDDFCKEAARKIIKLKKGCIFIITGFYVAGYAETDGPVGAYFLATGFKKLGWKPVVITDSICNDYFPDIDTIYMEYDSKKEEYISIIEEYNPSICLSIERCGRNCNDDYMNMRGESIREHTAKLDEIIQIANDCGIVTFGIGDGGNEIGMGNLSSVIEEELSVQACVVRSDYLVIATVSNWGAYGILAYLSWAESEFILPTFLDIKSYLKYINILGAVDGVTKKNTMTVDGFDMDVEREIIEELRNWLVNENERVQDCISG